jgi:hypothetical protein
VLKIKFSISPENERSQRKLSEPYMHNGKFATLPTPKQRRPAMIIDSANRPMNEL